MITLHEEIVVPRSVEQCFRYVADFRNAKEWDATATHALKITDGPVGLGSQFDLACAVGPDHSDSFMKLRNISLGIAWFYEGAGDTSM